MRIQLNLFAGQLYLGSYHEYQELWDSLRVISVKAPESMTVEAGGFIVGANQRTITKFSQSPLKLLRILMSQIKKECQEVDKTHIGKILDGRLLDPCDFQDPPKSNRNLSIRRRVK